MEVQPASQNLLTIDTLRHIKSLEDSVAQKMQQQMNSEEDTREKNSAGPQSFEAPVIEAGGKVSFTGDTLQFLDVQEIDQVITTTKTGGLTGSRVRTSDIGQSRSLGPICISKKGDIEMVFDSIKLVNPKIQGEQIIMDAKDGVEMLQGRNFNWSNYQSFMINAFQVRNHKEPRKITAFLEATKRRAD
ncbi:UNKNOWN [Stylonychia lemnae]|uniref:Uncharacterized protein n=1 Tax=Stylonychia lemnae TaxID=5949 RepID=A0A078AI73_STYLE|nr:UNKNOWN [Stylonychia lemnae]|eukprot:CDW81904.1 UNKNOWN [Stylonychia lemnae]